MANAGENSKWLSLSITLAVATISATAAAISFHIWSRKSRFDTEEKVRELETALKSSLDKCIAERQGRIRAQQALRKALVQTNCENLEWVSYPMAPIAVVRSCFSTRNGTPRQPLLVPLARANLLFHTARVPPASLEGLQEYSHCWIIYVFHMNTNLEKLWKHPSASKFKAKVRVPKLKGGRLGVFATRSPHRPCPIGLTVAKVEAVQGNMVQLSGVDLVDGTPVLDIKPYIPYCDSNETATVPSWVKEDSLLTTTSVNFADGFSTTLDDCWRSVGKKSLYASPDEFRSLIKEVLSWDIRSLSQRTRPHNSVMNTENGTGDELDSLDPGTDDGATNNECEGTSLPSGDVTYHLILEGLDVAYKIDCDDNVLVEAVSIPSQSPSTSQHHQGS